VGFQKRDLPILQGWKKGICLLQIGGRIFILDVQMKY
jgi:hypothetical protein